MRCLPVAGCACVPEYTNGGGPVCRFRDNGAWFQTGAGRTDDVACKPSTILANGGALMDVRRIHYQTDEGGVVLLARNVSTPPTHVGENHRYNLRWAFANWPKELSAPGSSCFSHFDRSQRRSTFRIMKLFFRNWPAPEKMSRDAYRRYRVTLLIHVIVSVGYAAAAFFLWAHVPLIGKILLVIVGGFFAPGTDVIENLFVSYDSYLKRGLW